jgi:hypothetical protein
LAGRKEKLRQRFTEAVEPELEPGEQLVAGAYAVAGPNPWLASVIGAIGMLLMGMRGYYVAVTDRRVMLVRATMWRSRPAGLAFAEPLASVEVTRVRSRVIWSSLRYRRPGGRRMRLNFHRIWRDDMQAFVAGLNPVTAVA